jgi:hypothetical protein
MGNAAWQNTSLWSKTLNIYETVADMKTVSSAFDSLLSDQKSFVQNGINPDTISLYTVAGDIQNNWFSRDLPLR